MSKTDGTKYTLNSRLWKMYGICIQAEVHSYIGQGLSVLTVARERKSRASSGKSSPPREREWTVKSDSRTRQCFGHGVWIHLLYNDVRSFVVRGCLGRVFGRGRGRHTTAGGRVRAVTRVECRCRRTQPPAAPDARTHFTHTRTDIYTNVERV